MTKKLRTHEEIKPFVLNHLDNNCLEIDEENFAVWLHSQCPTWIHGELLADKISCSVETVRKAVKELLEEGKVVEDRYHHYGNALFVHSKTGLKNLDQVRKEMQTKKEKFLTDSEETIRQAILNLMLEKIQVDENTLCVSLEMQSLGSVQWTLSRKPEMRQIFRAMGRDYTTLNRALRDLMKEGLLLESIQEGRNITYTSVEARQKMLKIQNDFELRRQGKKLATTKTGKELERILARHGVVADQTEHEITINQTQYDNLLSLLARVA